MVLLSLMFSVSPSVGHFIWFNGMLVHINKISLRIIHVNCHLLSSDFENIAF